MDPSPPKSVRTKKHFNRPFYESPKKTSAEIISEARSSVKTLETKRPFTPADGCRKLFGSTTSRDARPPSVISIASSYADSRPPTGRLTPIESSLEAKISNGYLSENSDDLDINQNVPKDLKKPLLKEPLLPTSPENLEKPLHKSYGVSPKHSELLLEKDIRRAHSGPKERTIHNKKEKDNLSRSSSTSNLDQYRNISEKSLFDRNVIYFEENLKPLLQQMKLNHLHNDIESLLVNFDMLWNTLEIGNLFGKSKLGSKRRSEILSTVYECTVNNNPHLHLKLAKIFISMEVSGRNLEAACKLIFKASRDKNNDKFFIEEKIISIMVSLLSSKHITDIAECLVYLVGAIKFLAMNEHAIKELLDCSILEHISKLLTMFKDKEVSLSATQDLNNILIQVLSLLNNLESQSSLKQRFIDLNILDNIFSLSHSLTKDTEYSLAFARLLSKLSSNRDACSVISSKTNLELLTDVLKIHFKKQELAVRLCYMFGNVANLNEDTRKNISLYKDVFLKVLVYYFQELSKCQHKKKDTTRSDIEDTIVKSIRVFANISIENDNGYTFANEIVLIDLLLTLAESSIKLNLGNELVVTVAAAINNLSYFMNGTYLCRKQVEFTDALMKVLFMENMECVLEVIRVLGNFTQTKLVRQRIVSNKVSVLVFEVLVSLLDANNGEVIFATCGVLINMMVDKENRQFLKQYGGIANLIDCLKDLADSDWLLAGMICQIFWNYSEFITSSAEYFGEENADDLITLLTELTDPDLAIDHNEVTDTEQKQLSRESWNTNFIPVATLLLQRLESHHCMLEPIVTEPD